MKKIKILGMFLIALTLQSFAQDARYVYGPVTGINLDDMFAIADQVFQNNETKTEKFSYSGGVIHSSNYNFLILISEYRCNIEVKNTDKGAYISFINLQMKNSNGSYTDVASVLGKKTNKLIAAIGKEFEAISKDADKIEVAKQTFYNDPNTHYLFFKKATELATERWYEKFMKDKTFKWMLSFTDIKSNESTSFADYKYVVTARYYIGSSLVGTGGLYVRLYTNDEKHMMTEKGTKINVEGKCVGFKEYMGTYYINFVQE